MTLDYNPGMRQTWEITIFGRLLLVLGIILLLGITPQRHDLTRQFRQVNRASTVNSWGEAARLTADLAVHIPWRSDLWEKAGDYAMQAEDYSDAVSYYESAAENGWLSEAGKLSLAEAYLYNSELGQSELVLQGLLRDEPNNTIYIRLFQVHRLQNDYPSALQDLQAMTEIEPEDANNYYVAGLLQLATHPEQALPFFKEAADLEDGFQPTVTAMQRYLLLPQFDESPYAAFLISGRVLIALEEWELAQQAFQQATISDPDGAEAWAYLGESRQHANGNASFYANLYPVEGLPETSDTSAANDADVLANLEKALTLDPQLSTGYVFQALYWQRQQSYDLALDSIEKAIALQPGEPALYSQKGSIQAMLGDLAGALEAYQNAVSFSEDDPDYLRLLMVFCITYEYQVDEVAIPAARLMLQQNSEDPEALDLAGQALYLLKDPAAGRYLQRALDQDEEYAPAHLHLGMIYLRKGEYALAREKFLLVQSLSPYSAIATQAQRLLDMYFP